MKKIKIAPSTKSGASHWLHQRISAIAMIPLTIWIAFSGIYISQDPFNYISVFTRVFLVFTIHKTTSHTAPYL